MEAALMKWEKQPERVERRFSVIYGLHVCQMNCWICLLYTSREKIESNPKEPRYLKVVWGTGYKVG